MKLIPKQAYTGNRKADEANRNNMAQLRKKAPRASYNLKVGNNDIRHFLGRVPLGRRIISQSNTSEIADVRFTRDLWVVYTTADTVVTVEWELG